MGCGCKKNKPQEVKEVKPLKLNLPKVSSNTNNQSSSQQNNQTSN